MTKKSGVQKKEVGKYYETSSGETIKDVLLARTKFGEDFMRFIKGHY